MYYLIEHNRRTKETKSAEFSNYSEVQNIALEKEQFYFRNNKKEMEVVVFEANSLNDLKDTHSRYFVKYENKYNNTNQTLLGVGVAVGLVGLAIFLLNKDN